MSSLPKLLTATSEMQHGTLWVLDGSKINDVQNNSLRRLVEVAKKAHFTDIQVRIDGKFQPFEGDWIKNLIELKGAGGMSSLPKLKATMATMKESFENSTWFRSLSPIEQEAYRAQQGQGVSDLLATASSDVTKAEWFKKMSKNGQKKYLAEHKKKLGSSEHHKEFSAAGLKHVSSHKTGGIPYGGSEKDATTSEHHRYESDNQESTNKAAGHLLSKGYKFDNNTNKEISFHLKHDDGNEVSFRKHKGGHTITHSKNTNPLQI